MTDNTGISSPQTPKWLTVSFLVISFLGFLDALYLTIQHFRGVAPACAISGCDIVTSSKYAVFAGVPVALPGTLYYLTILLLTVAALTTQGAAPFRLAIRLTVLGFLFSIYLVWLQWFVIRSFCQYCIGSAVTSTALFVLSFFVRKNLRSRERIPTEYL